MALAASGVIRGSAWNYVHLIGPDLQFAAATGSANVGGQLTRIRLQHLGRAGLDQRAGKWRSARDVEAEAVMGGIDPGVVEADHARRGGRADGGIGLRPFACGREPEGQVDQR